MREISTGLIPISSSLKRSKRTEDCDGADGNGYAEGPAEDGMGGSHQCVYNDEEGQGIRQEHNSHCRELSRIIYAILKTHTEFDLNRLIDGKYDNAS